MDYLPEVSPRPPEQFINLLTETGYKKMKVIEPKDLIVTESNCEKVAA